jgi:hypothetical protein
VDEGVGVMSPELPADWEPSEVQLQAMQAIFDLHDAMDVLSINDLLKVMRFAVADGEESLLVRMTMVQFAAKKFKEERCDDKVSM